MASFTLLLSLGALAAYLLTVRRLIYRRMNHHLIKYRRYLIDAEALGQMTLKDACDIQLALAELELPNSFSAFIFFALSKVCWLLYLSSRTTLMEVGRHIVYLPSPAYLLAQENSQERPQLLSELPTQLFS